MKIYKDVKECMSDKAKKAIQDGLFPGARVELIYNPNNRPDLVPRTNIFLSDGEEFISPVDGRTTLVGKFVYTDNPLNGWMRNTRLSIKGE